MTLSHTCTTSQSIQKARHSIRQKMRLQRRELSRFQHRNAAKRLSLNLKKLLARNLHKFDSQSKNTLKIGVYLATDGEINPLLAKTLLNKSTTELYFPIIQKNKTLTFGIMTNNKLPRRNIYNIAEPDRKKSIHIRHLDIILLPLVAASTSCDRLGMGGGFYDRSLAQISHIGRTPYIIGIAHDFQIINSLPIQPWDQPTHAIATDQRLITNKRRRPYTYTLSR